MTEKEFNQRIEKLTERHEALALSVEHLVEEGQRVDDRLTVMTAAMAHLIRIAEAHENRLDDLEDGQ